MCWLPVDQPLILYGDDVCVRTPSPCSVAQLLACRLRYIGDRVEKRWKEKRYRGGGRKKKEGEKYFQSFLRTAIHLTVLVLLVTRRHL